MPMPMHRPLGSEEAARPLLACAASRSRRAGVGDRDGDEVVPGHLRVVRLLDELVDRESDAALDGELDRVVQEVEQHLPQPLLVAAHVDRKVGAE